MDFTPPPVDFAPEGSHRQGEIALLSPKMGLTSTATRTMMTDDDTRPPPADLPPGDGATTSAEATLVARNRELLEAGRAVVEELRDPTPRNDPIELVELWQLRAEAAGIFLAESMALSTVSPEGRPSCRVVLLKGVDAQGFRFFTNYESRKAHELEANPLAALTLHWGPLERQIRIEGRVERLTRLESFEYFSTRPRESRIGAWASHQSRPLASREELLARVHEYEREFEGEEVPLPPYWGGYRLVPDLIEFWQGRPSRLHDRWSFTRDDPESGWQMVQLQP